MRLLPGKELRIVVFHDNVNMMWAVLEDRYSKNVDGAMEGLAGVGATVEDALGDLLGQFVGEGYDDGSSR